MAASVSADRIINLVGRASGVDDTATRWLQLDPQRRCTPWLVGFALAAIALFAPQNAKPFVYFQF